jgi:uncharacterized protein YjdB
MSGLRIARLGALAAFLASLTTIACSIPDRPVAPEPEFSKPSATLPGGVQAQISDTAATGEPHFYWLPPVAPARSFSGTFDNNVFPELRLCRLTAGNCAAPLVATYTRSTNPAITVSNSAYSLDWSTKPATITSGDYRAEVWVKGRRLGFADARVVDNAKDVKNVPAGFVGVQKGKSVAFAFRLELGIVGSIVLSPVDVFIEVGGTLQFTATVRDVRDATLTGIPVVWQSANPAIAAVSSTGLVTGVAEDTTVITASLASGYGKVSASRTIPVVRAGVASVVVTPSSDSTFVGQTLQLTAHTFDARGAELFGRLVSWSSTNHGAAAVSSSGLVTGVAAGVDTITATSEGKTGRARILVKPAAVHHIVISPASPVSIAFGDTAAFTATAYDANNNVLTGRTFGWDSNDAFVAIVTPNVGATQFATASAAGVGTTFIYARIGAVADSVKIVVAGATVTGLRPWLLPQIWFLSGPYGRAIRAKYGTPTELGTVPPGTISGSYYPIAPGGVVGGGQYVSDIINGSPASVTVGDSVLLQTGNLVSPTVTALDSLFKLDQGATWDSTANGGLGAIVSSNAPRGEESVRVVLVPLYDFADQQPGKARVRFRGTAYVFVDTYSRETVFGETRGDIVFRFLRFGP